MIMETINRLQFRHHNDIFETREDAIEYIYDKIKEEGKGLAEDQNSPYSYSLFAEPTILRYKNEDEETGCEYKKGPHIMVVIGSETNDTIYHDRNRFCIIDIDKTEDEIKNLEEELAKAVKSLTLAVLDTSTLDLHVEKTEDGTFLSGDVKTAKTHIYDNVVKENNLMVVPFDDEAGPEGLFIYVDLTYDEPNETFTFVVSNADGTLKKQSVKLPNNYLVSGRYNKEDESLYLHMKEGEDVIVDCEELINEWGVEGDASNTPIVLTREEVDYGISGDPSHHHVEPWQDVLRADVRLASDRRNNILEKTIDGRYLYVDGVASNIIYKWNGEDSNVAEQLDKLNQIKISQDNDNIIWDRADGFFASTKLEYLSTENTLVFTTSNVSGENTVSRIPLNTVQVIKNAYYDPTTEELVIIFVNDKGEDKEVRIQIGSLIEEWDVLNNGHSVKLDRARSTGSGKDILTADVNISNIENNILEVRSEHDYHALFVKGTADNIKYGDTTVKSAIDALKSEDARIDSKLDEEIARAEGEEQRIEGRLDQEITDRTADVERIDTTIGDGFSTDAHETVTYKFNELQTKVNSEADKLQAEINRSKTKDTEHDGRLDAIDAEIGDGFGPRNTVRDEIDNLQSEIDAVSADSSSRLSDVINEDKSIDVETRADAAGKPTVKVVKVNLSTEVEDDRKNIIKLNSDGLFANVDLSYIEEANKLIFHTSNGEPDKEIQLESMSSIVDIKYDPNKEAIIITYMTNGHEIKTVEIPVGDLIREWKPSENTDGAIKLTLTEAPSGTTGKDILYGEVLISDHADNILINDAGRLYVSNAGIVANAAAIDALEGRMNTAEADINALENELREETSARTLSDEALGRRIDQEIEDRVADVNDEQSRAEAAELALSGKIDTDILAEKNRAISAETELRTAINDEATRATGEEARIERLLNNEVSRSTAKDNEHDARIQQNADNILTETERAKGVENVISGNVISEETRATAEETAIRTALNTETSNRTAADETLAHSIADEEERRISGDTILQTNIAGEEARAREIEDRLETWINNEVSRATSAETALNAAITAETLRAQDADNELYQKVSDETAVRAAADADLLSKINQEVSRAQVAENTISEALTTETNNRVNADENLSNAITAETQARQSADDTLYAAIAAATFTFDDTTSIDFNTPTLEDNVVKAEVKLQEGDNIIKVGQGLYATAHLSYDTGTNKIKLTTTAGEEEYQLAGATVIDNLEYDSTNKELVITYHDGNGGVHTVRFGVSELFNEWSVQNPSEDSAIELTKTPSATPGGEDKLSGRVLLTNLEDNAIKIVNNGLYVPAADMADAKEIALCAKNELSVLERAVIGHKIYEECGSGYTYEPNVDATYISGATNFYNADFKLDQNLKRVEGKVDEVSGGTVCVDSKANKIYELLYGTGSTIQGCGEGIQYSPDLGSCVISAATSFMEADRMLGDQMCEILEMWQSGETCTTKSDWVDDGANKKMIVDVKVSRGNDGTMTDDEIIIENLNGDYIDPTRTEFTDTNALRIVCLQEGAGGVIPAVNSPQNGVYLSNVWDCGLYYDEDVDADAITAANAAGYKTDDYRTDTGSTASNYDYNNNVRQ